MNLEAIDAGLASPEQARGILDWLDGKREVEGDTFQEVLSMASGARFSGRSHTVQPLQPAASPPFLAVVA
jgi:hypothetical protein